MRLFALYHSVCAIILKEGVLQVFTTTFNALCVTADVAFDAAGARRRPRAEPGREERDADAAGFESVPAAPRGPHVRVGGSGQSLVHLPAHHDAVPGRHRSPRRRRVPGAAHQPDTASLPSMRPAQPGRGAKRPEEGVAGGRARRRRGHGAHDTGQRAARGDGEASSRQRQHGAGGRRLAHQHLRLPELLRRRLPPAPLLLLPLTLTVAALRHMVPSSCLHKSSNNKIKTNMVLSTVLVGILWRANPRRSFEYGGKEVLSTRLFVVTVIWLSSLVPGGKLLPM